MAIHPCAGTRFRQGRDPGHSDLHELAHAIGLDHVESEAEQMNPHMSYSAPEGYGSGDCAGLKQIGKEAGCIPVPAGALYADLS
jgi:hypothetical protein